MPIEYFTVVIFLVLKKSFSFSFQSNITEPVQIVFITTGTDTEAPILLMAVTVKLYLPEVNDDNEVIDPGNKNALYRD